MLDAQQLTRDWRDVWSGSAEREPVGAVFTRPEIVDLILDLVGYVPGRARLAKRRVLEPSCGDGAFTSALVARLIVSERKVRGVVAWDDPTLDDALRAADINLESIEATRALIVAQLVAAGCPSRRARSLASQWTVHTDFLLANWGTRFDLVVGNPPYVRIEDLPKQVLSLYRSLYATTTDRADLYVAFFEKGLQLLSASGQLAFICANRWTKNMYGAALRQLVSRAYHVKAYLNLEHTQPFLSDVSAYPAVFVIDRKQGAPTRAATLDSIDTATLATARRQTLRAEPPEEPVSEFSSWYSDGTAWLSTSRDEHRVLARLDLHPTIEASAPGTKVGIGVATGADRVFVLRALDPEIESSRQIPMLMAANITPAGLNWSSRYLINPFDKKDDGSLVDLDVYPGLRAHFEANAKRLVGRHVAKMRPRSWYRTIDRIWPALQHKPKLVIPDIQSGGVVGYDEGRYYPHDNVYWITSDAWDLRALQAILRSTIVLQQVRAYSVQMRGGSLRYQAQTLRRVRVPRFADLPALLVERLVSASDSDCQGSIDAAVSEAYNASIG
jgi:methylase of polypeptide subunit release factors